MIRHIFSDQLELGIFTPRNSLGNPISHSTPSAPKIVKVFSFNFDHLDIYTAINLSRTINIQKFDELKMMLECGLDDLSARLFQ